MDFTILECKRFIAPSGKFTCRRISHYELDFYVSGRRETEIDGRKSVITEGCICFRRPGQIAGSVGDYDCFVSTLDFSGNAVSFGGRQTESEPEPEFRHDLIDGIPDVFRVYHENEIHSRFMYISDLADCDSMSAKLAMKEILLLINADLCRARLEKEENDNSPAGRVIRYINSNFNRSIGLDEFAAVADLDKSYLVRLFKANYGMSPIEYLIGFRLDHARTLLTNTDLAVCRIAAECGYNSSSFFVSSFRERFGCTPGAFRDMHSK